MSNIYVPIDYTNLKDFIPPEEEILYSTICKVVEKYEKGPGTTRTKKVRYTSHALITNKKIYYLRNKSSLAGKIVRKLFTDGEGKSPDLQYIPLNSMVIKSDNRLHYVLTLGIDFTLVIQMEYESQEAFNERKEKFGAFMLPLLIKAGKEHLKEKEGKDHKFFERAFLKKLKKRIPKMEKQLKTKYP